MTYNTTNLPNGDYRVEVYITRSPAQIIDFMHFVIQDVAQQLGVLGLFTAFLFILVVIFGLALKPSFLIMAVPFALLTTKLMGILSLSNTAIVVFFLAGIIATAVASK
jgi:hypothetical protein